ncbi:unnamed protein product [Sphagnum jensenii]|uniref:Uncharacterized protein n=1 Tax=Sphagnum jensenii TaxID=128206 RepID=A0ABP1BSU1_9BRYO
MSLQEVTLVMMVGGRSMRSVGCWVVVSSSWLVMTVITVLAVVQLHVMVADALLSATQVPPSQLLKDQSKDLFDRSNNLGRLVPVLPKPRSPPKKGPGANVTPLPPSFALPPPPPFALPPSPLP